MRKISIQPPGELLFPSTFLDESIHIMRNIKRQLPRERLVHEIGPCSTLKNRIIIFAPPRAVAITRPHKALKAQTFHIGIPQILPISGTFHILLGNLFFFQSTSQCSNGIVTIGILHGTSPRALEFCRYKTLLIIITDTAASFLSLVITGRHFGVLYHRLQCQFVIDTFQSFDISIGKKYIDIRSTLHPAIVVSTPCIGSISFVPIYIQQRTQHIYLFRRRQQCE